MKRIYVDFLQDPKLPQNDDYVWLFDVESKRPFTDTLLNYVSFQNGSPHRFSTDEGELSAIIYTLRTFEEPLEIMTDNESVYNILGKGAKANKRQRLFVEEIKRLRVGRTITFKKINSTDNIADWVGKGYTCDREIMNKERALDGELKKQEALMIKKLLDKQ